MLEITWMVDSCGVESAHRNGPNMTKDQSYLGHLVRSPDKQGWLAKIQGLEEPLGPFESYTRARSALVRKLMEIG